MVLLQRKPYFSKDPEGVQLFLGGGGGVQMLISIETHITCDLQGGGGGGRGSGPLFPPLDQHMKGLTLNLGAQWLSGRVLDSRLRGRGFEPHPPHCVVSLRKNINPSLVLVQPRKTHPFITERLLVGRKDSNQAKQKL